MVTAADRPVYFSFLMFTADLQPDNPAYMEVIAEHIKELSSYGYDGFDLPIAPMPITDHRAEIASYEGLRRRLEELGLGTWRYPPTWPRLGSSIRPRPSGNSASKLLTICARESTSLSHSEDR
jgi:hypothetical protein